MDNPSLVPGPVLYDLKSRYTLGTWVEHPHPPVDRVRRHTLWRTGKTYETVEERVGPSRKRTISSLRSILTSLESKSYVTYVIHELYVNNW